MKGVSDKDMGRFRYVGYEAPVPAVARPTSHQLFESAVRALESPTARLMKAVYYVVVELAERGDLDEMPANRVSEGAVRRLGYVAARAADSSDVNSGTANALARFAEGLYRSEFADKAPLAVAATQTDSYLRVLQRRADALSRKWQVYGKLFPSH